MKHLLRARKIQPTLLFLALLALAGSLWAGTSILLPLPQFIRTLALSIPSGSLIAVLTATAIGLSSYPDIKQWERVAPRNIFTISQLLTGFYFFAFTLIYLVCAMLFGHSTSIFILPLKLLVLLILQGILFSIIGSKVSLLPTAILLLSTAFARTPTGGIAPWAWLLNTTVDYRGILVTVFLAGLSLFLFSRTPAKRLL